MRYAILGDVHANWEALSAVLADVDTVGVDACATIGDIVGYNADPARCLDALRSRGCAAVQGNHDYYAATPPHPGELSDMASAAIAWTRRQLDEDALKHLAGLPRSRLLDGFTLVHNSLDTTNDWSYVFDASAAADSMLFQFTEVCFHGHTHVPVAFEKAVRVTASLYTDLELDPDRQYFINVGSVGQPRDRDPRAAWVVYDREARRISLRRVTYDVEAARAKIHDARLPRWLALRLGVGV